MELKSSLTTILVLIITLVVSILCILSNRRLKSLGLNLPQLQTISGLNLQQKAGAKVKKMIFFIITALIILTLAILAGRPVYSVPQNQGQVGLDVMYTFDISPSMYFDVEKPDDLEAEIEDQFVDYSQTRMSEAVKATISSLSFLTTDRTGLVLYFRDYFTAVPLTTQKNYIEYFLNRLENRELVVGDEGFASNGGTATGDALAYTATKLKLASNREKVIILITDGNTNNGRTVAEVTPEIVQAGVRVYPIIFGGNAITASEEQSMQKLAQASGGRYFRSPSANDIEQAMRTIENLEKKDLVEKVPNLLVDNPLPEFVALAVLIPLFLITKRNYEW